MNHRGWLGIYLLAVLLALTVLLPVAWLAISSLTQLSELLSRPLRWLPQQPTLERYGAIVSGSAGEEFRFALRNSMAVAALSTGVSLITAVLAAYAFSSFGTPRRLNVLYALLATYMMPPVAIALPLYQMLAALSLLNTVWGLSLVYTSFLTPFLTWILKGFFDSIPRELEEAARIDGASYAGALRHVTLPLSLPGVTTASLFGVLIAWDEFFYALIFTSTSQAKTLPVAIAEFTTRHAVDFGLMSAGGIVAALPPVLLAFALQRYLIAGLTAGAVKA